jgi:hypothetical protein
MKPITIKTGDYELVDSGVFHVLEKSKSVIEYPSFKIYFDFEKDSNQPTSIKANAIEGGLEITLINVNDLMYGTIDLVKIGQIDSKNLYLAFTIGSLNDKTIRIVEYSLYAGN